MPLTLQREKDVKLIDVYIYIFSISKNDTRTHDKNRFFFYRFSIFSTDLTFFLQIGTDLATFIFHLSCHWEGK